MNLKGKTIFDFCKDITTIHRIIGGEYSESYYKGFPKTVIASNLMEYAWIIQDKELFESAKRLHQSETDKWNNQCSQTDVIID